MLDSLTRALNARFLDRLVATPRGRAFILGFLVENEEADEAGVFDNLLARVDDPKLHELVRKHRDDEERHARILQACLDRTGVPPVRLHEEQRILPILNRDLGDLAECFVADRRSVMEAYLFLQVIEERAVHQYPAIARAFAKVDPVSADVIESVIRDETRHVKYCQAISKRYAPDPATLEKTLHHYRDVEALSIVEHGQHLTRTALAHDLLEITAPERLLWRTLLALGDRRPPSPLYTAFAAA